MIGGDDATSFSKEADHAMRLLREYEQAEGVLAVPDLMEMSKEEEGSEDSKEQPASWAGEEYEEDRVAGIKDTYLKFSSRLARQPAQCVRYDQ